MLQPHVHQTTENSRFRDLGQRYFNYWGEDSLHLAIDEHRDIRVALMRVLKQVPSDGAIAFCGTGPNIARNRDLDPSIIGGHLVDYPALILSDFSQEMLSSTYRSIQELRHTVTSRLHLVIRDFSRTNLGAKFDALMREKIAAVRNVQEMDEFVKFLRESVGIQEVEKQPLPEDFGRIDPRLVAKPDAQRGLQFDKVLDGLPVRMIVANLLITGMFAVTEMDFRNKLAELKKQHPKQMTDDLMIEYLSVWHDLLLSLNEKVSTEFIEDALHANDEVDGSAPLIFLSVDDTVTYDGLQGFDRLRMKQLRNTLPKGATLREIDKTHWDHSHESIPHQHSVSVAVVSRK